MAKFEYMERAFSSELRPRARLVLQVLVLHDELVEAGYIIKQARFDERKNGGQTSNLYTLCTEVPQQPVPEQPTKQEPPAQEVTDGPENTRFSAPDATPGEQSALFLFPAYSFSHGFDKRKTGRHFCRPDAVWAGGQSIFKKDRTAFLPSGCCVGWGAVHFCTPLNRTSEQILTDEKKSNRRRSNKQNKSRGLSPCPVRIAAG